jgi:hypothetical protein
MKTQTLSAAAKSAQNNKKWSATFLHEKKNNNAVINRSLVFMARLPVRISLYR